MALERLFDDGGLPLLDLKDATFNGIGNLDHRIISREWDGLGILTMKWVTYTVRSCPIRCTRSIAINNLRSAWNMIMR